MGDIKQLREDRVITSSIVDCATCLNRGQTFIYANQLTYTLHMVSSL